jgi:hypothetical protein
LFSSCPNRRRCSHQDRPPTSPSRSAWRRSCARRRCS